MTRLTAQQIENLPEWMPVRDFEGFYEANCREGIVRNSMTLKVLKANPNGDYPRVGLFKGGRRYFKTVHRLVANAAFGYHNISTAGLLVMHLDEERNDPRISNLALGTAKENANFPKAKQRRSEVTKGEKNYWFNKHLSEEHRKKLSEAAPKKAVGAYKNGELIMVFQSTREAGRNGFGSCSVSACCRGKEKTHKGYQWRFL